MSVQWLQQVLSPAVSRAYRGGLDQAEGLVVDAVAVSFARTATEVVEAFGWESIAAQVVGEDGSVDVLRFSVSPFHRLVTAYGPGFAPPGEMAFVEPAPFTGNGFTASQAEFVPVWKLSRSRLVPGTELWRVGPDGAETLLDAYRGVAGGWGNASNGVPSHLLGPKADWDGTECLADVDKNGSVELVHLGQTGPGGFEIIRPYVWARSASAAEVGSLSETVLTCRWRGHPFEVFNSGGGSVSLSYTGGDQGVARQLGLNYAQPTVYEITVPDSEITDLQAMSRELEL